MINKLENKADGAKYEQLMTLMRERISNGYYAIGEQLPSENDLVREFNISRHTVLKGFSGLVAEGWVERRRGKGTFVASRFTQKTEANTNIIAFICSSHDQYMVQQIARGISKYAGSADREVLFMNSQHDPEKEAELVMGLGQRGIGGAVIWPLVTGVNCSRYESLYQHGFPMVMVDRGLENVSVPVVCSDHEYAAYEVVSHLLSLGHERIAHITFKAKEHERCDSAINLRESGYRRALKEKGIPIREEYVCRISQELRQLAYVPSVLNMLAYEPAHQLMNLPEPPTAIFLLNDQFAPSVCRALSNEGLSIPEDVSVAGFDNDPYAWEMARPITTYAQPAVEIGQAAAELLEQMMMFEKVEPQTTITLKGNLIVRDTTAAPKMID